MVAIGSWSMSRFWCQCHRCFGRGLGLHWSSSPTHCESGNLTKSALSTSSAHVRWEFSQSVDEEELLSSKF